MNFLSQMFLPALLVGAAPFLIHLLNRRRYRTVEWAAMDFLRQAVHRNRRFLVLRDLILMAMRTLAVLLFVLAMCRPYRQAAQQAGFSGEPVHAVLCVDNSGSMGYSQLDKTLLDLAKDKASKFIRELPSGSKISLVPMCEYAAWHGKDVYSTPESALEALQRIELVDRTARSSQVAERAAHACRAAKDLPTKRVAFLSDMQAETWSARGLGDYFREIHDVQIAQIGSEKRSNTWVSDFRLRDAVADAESPAVFLATIRHQGPEPRQNVRVSLKVLEDRPGEKADYAVIEERRVDLVPGQSLEVMFKHTFEVPGTPAEPRYVAVRVEITPDHLPGDDFRTIIVPVVAKVPVVFIDQYGREEKPSLNQYGETFPLRRLLAPKTSRQEDDKQLVEVRHRKAAEVTQEDLKDARLVAIAGIKAPTDKLVRLLREYVEQGGVVFLAAGGEFDPMAWQQTAFLDGAGILPAPLKPVMIGKLPVGDAQDPEVFHLAPATMSDPIFHLDMPPQELADMLTAPFFYKAVAVDMAAAPAMDAAERKRIEARRAWFKANDENEKLWAEQERKGQLAAADKDRREADRLARKDMEPKWLLWSVRPEKDPADMAVEELIRRGQPQVMGQYDNGEVFAVRRDIGLGRVIMMTTGCWPQWNNLAVEQSVLLLDQALRGLMTRSLPKRTFGPVNEVVVPIDPADQGADFTIRGPDEEQARPISVEALSQTSFGLIVRSVEQRGVYRIHRERSNPKGGAPKDDSWTMLLAVNGPSEEGELASIDEEGLRQRMGTADFRWLSGEQDLRLEGMALVGHNYWKYLMVMAMACLLGEMLFLAAPALRRRAA